MSLRIKIKNTVCHYPRMILLLIKFIRNFSPEGPNEEHLLNIKRNMEIDLHRSNQPEISLPVVVCKETNRWQAINAFKSPYINPF